jgi:hypothetical protein
MAQYYNTNLTNVSDLIFYLDAVNPRSYPGSGSTWFDLSPNKNNFTLFNTPTYTQNGTTGTYLTFNGSNQYARSTNAINFNAYSAVTIEIGYRSTVTNSTQVIYETTGTGGSTATGGITLLMNANSTSTVANAYLSQWQGYGTRLFGFTPSTNTSFNSIAETFVNGSDSIGRQTYVNGTTAQFFTNTAVTVVTSATTSGLSFANTWTYVASRAGTGNFFRGDIAYIRAWGTKINSSNVTFNSAGIGARQVNSYQFPTILLSDPSLTPPAALPASDLSGIFTGAANTFVYSWANRWTTTDTQPTGGWNSIAGNQNHFVSGFGFSATPTSAGVSVFTGSNLATYQNSNRTVSAVTAPQGASASYTVSDAINFASFNGGAWLEGVDTRTLQFTIGSSLTNFGNATGFITQAYGGGGGYHKCFVFQITHGGISRLFAPKFSVNVIGGSALCYIFYPLTSDFTSFTDSRLTSATGNILTASYFQY